MSKIFFLACIIVGLLHLFIQDVDSELCNADGLYAEIIKAIETLKLKEKNATTSILRQDDDDEDIPYYVPAIAKVIAGVLAQNATNVIEESFGFIPPEINKNVQYVLGLVADTVTKLRPTTAPIISASNGQSELIQTSTETDPQKVADLEALLAFALAQEINKTINSNSNPDSIVSIDPVPIIPNHPEIAIVTPTESTESSKQPLESITSVASEVDSSITSTPKLLAGNSVQSDSNSNGGVNSNSNAAGLFGTLSNDQFVYAPAYAPAYVETTTSEPLPVYAPNFDYQNYTAPPSVQKFVVKVSENLNATTSTTQVISTTEDEAETEVPTTTEDDDDYEDGDNK